MGAKELKAKHTLWQTLGKGLQSWELRLIELRYNGYGFSDISKKLNEEFPNPSLEYKIYALRHKMYHGGNCRAPYEAYVDLMNSEAVDESINLLRSTTGLAVRTLISLLKPKVGSEATRLGAVKEILDRVHGKSTQKVVIEDEHEEAVEELRGIVKNLTKQVNVRATKKTSGKPARDTEKRPTRSKPATKAVPRGRAKRK